MLFTIFDIEANGLDPDILWVLSYKILNEKYEEISKGYLTDYDNIVEFFQNQQIIVGHNIINYDIPVLKKLIPKFAYNNKIIDTLGLSWYLYPIKKFEGKKFTHGLEDWGLRFNYPKVKVTDWNNPELLPLYIERCNVDVEINSMVFIHLYSYLLKLYEK